MISVIIVEDNADNLYLLKTIISTAGDLVCVGVAINGKEAIEIIEDARPDVVLMDIVLPDTNGIECVKLLKPKYPKTEFVMCTALDEEEKVFTSIEAGASSYLLKRSSAETIVNTIKEVYEGRSPMSSDIARKMINVFHRKLQRPDFGITKKENEILQLLSLGHTYQEIADLVKITVKTLKSHIYRMYEKLQVDNRTEAINKFFGGPISS